MARIFTSVLRIASIAVPRNVRLALAANIFVAAGVVIIFIINLFFTQRIVRSLHPNAGWHRAGTTIFRLLGALIALTLIIVITATVQSFYTLSTRTRLIDRGLQLYGACYLAVVATLPILFVITSIITPRHAHDRFGQGRLRSKILTLLLGSFLVSVGAWYRFGTALQKPIPRSQPLPVYFSKAPFYFFNFGVEVMVVYLYAIMRVDRRFHVPDGARWRQSYAPPAPPPLPQEEEDEEEEKSDEEKSDGATDIEKTAQILEMPRPVANPEHRKSGWMGVKRPLSIPDPNRRTWTLAEQERIIRRLGGPWEIVSDPEELSPLPSPDRSFFTAGSDRPPSIPSTITIENEWPMEDDMIQEWDSRRATMDLDYRK